MTSLHPGRYTLGVIAAVAILTACGGSQPPIGAGGAMQQATPVRGVVAPLRREHKPEVLYSFTGSPDGADPWSSVVVSVDHPASDPFLIGTTLKGGDQNNDGTMYGLTKGKKGAWTASVLYTFRGANYSDGSEPVGIWKPLDATSPIFVTTVVGGTSNNGTVDELAPTGSGPWTESFTYSFGGTPDGADPYGPVVADKAGNLYGTTSAGGKSGAGTVYRMSPKGSSYIETVLYSFQSGTDGDHPYSGLIIDQKGALYGTTVEGGTTGSGTVFKLTPSGSVYEESILYSFQGPPSDGAAPYGGLTPVGTLPLAAGGKVVGMASSGGNQGYGVIYQLTLSGSSAKESVLWNFGSVSGDGAYPYGNACTNEKGAIYGTTRAGGAGGSSGLGTFFTLTPSSNTYKESVYSFTGPNGANPYAGPSVDSKGNLYVTTASGGSKDEGAVVTDLGPDNIQKKHVCG
jgi:uncharacterized repeat protein (TIGR03803 family)